MQYFQFQKRVSKFGFLNKHFAELLPKYGMIPFYNLHLV
jgi:hypothetical protein